MKRLIIAIQFLTRLPTPRVASGAQDFAGSMRWFPAVGLLIGAIVAGTSWLGANIDPWTAALAALAAWVVVTGSLHLDGLSDLADGCGAAHGNRDRLLAVMADPHVGSFGVVAITLQLVAKLVLLHALGSGWPALILIPFAARIGPLFWAHQLPPLHAGLGARFTKVVGPADLILWTALLLVATLFVPGLLAAILLVPAWTLWLKRKIGGISGDGHGAGIELVETGLLLACVTACRL